MTAPKWGGPWIGKVAAHGHWETPDTVDLILDQVPESVSLAAYWDFLASGAVTQTDGFVSTASVTNQEIGASAAGEYTVEGQFGPIPGGAVGTVVGAIVNVSASGHAAAVTPPGLSGLFQATLYTRRVSGDTTSDTQESPGSWGANNGVALAVSDLADVPSVSILVGLRSQYEVDPSEWGIHPEKYDAGLYEMAAEITAITLTVTYQPPDVWVPD